MDVSLQSRLYLPTRIEIVHIAVNDSLQHHLGMIWTTASFLIQFLEIVEPEIVDDPIYHPDRIVFRNIFIETLRKKYHLFGIVVPKV